MRDYCAPGALYLTFRVRLPAPGAPDSGAIAARLPHRGRVWMKMEATTSQCGRWRGWWHGCPFLPPTGVSSRPGHAGRLQALTRAGHQTDPLQTGHRAGGANTGTSTPGLCSRQTGAGGRGASLSDPPTAVQVFPQGPLLTPCGPHPTQHLPSQRRDKKGQGAQVLTLPGPLSTW